MVKVRSLEDTLHECEKLTEAPDFAAVSRWKEKNPGRKAVGCFPVYTPVELIHAAGMLPVGVMGAGNRLEIAYADARFQSFVCSIVKSTLELGLTERLQDLDGMVFHSICDPARNLASVFKRNFPDLFVEFIHFPQNLQSSRAVDYLVSEYRRVLGGLEGLTGKTVDNREITESIQLYNRIRGLIRFLYRFREDKPHLLSASETLLLLQAGTLLPADEQLSLLEEVQEALSRREARPRDRIKVVLEGSFCELPPLELIQSIEEAGCYILDDDFLSGWRWFLEDVPLNGDPVRCLAESYINNSVYSATKHDLREPKAKHLVQRAKKTEADAVIILAAKFCEPALFDYALYKKALEEEGIPHLFLEFEEKMWIFDRTRSEVETFVESMLFD